MHALLPVLALPAYTLAQMTALAQLAPRQADSAFVGYISGPSGYSDSRSCDYPQTLSTSGSYVQCCASGSICPFYTTCSSNTLLAAGGTSVACDVNTGLACNTAIVLPATLAENGESYLACWQGSLGTDAFTIVKTVATGAFHPLTATGSSSTETTAASASGTMSTSLAPPTGSAESSATSSSRAGSTTSGTSSMARATGSSTAAAATTSTSAAAGVAEQTRIGGAGLGWLLLLMQPFL